MPTYTFKHKETEEITEEFLRVSELDQFKLDNEHLLQVILRAPMLVSGQKSALTIAGGGWQDHLKAIKKTSGKENTINT
tara:strand:- start:15371 stop:15607 length:237 start_codon:yes stop_codon:yes gene_type:complete